MSECVPGIGQLNINSQTNGKLSLKIKFGFFKINERCQRRVNGDPSGAVTLTVCQVNYDFHRER